MAGINARLQSSAIGRSALGGAAETLGFYTPGMTDQPVGSFLGIRETAQEMGIDRGRLSRAGKLARRGRFGAAARAIGGPGATGGGTAARFAGKTFMKSIPLLSSAFFAYQGYQEGGTMGALGGLGESMLYSAGFRMAGTMLANPMTLTLGGLAAIGYGGYQLGEAAQRRGKGLRELEMSSDKIIDALGSAGAATTRQRAMMALNNTHINGRMAMGNEAALMHGDVTTGLRRF